MTKSSTKILRFCIYCGGAVSNERRGEHIIPEAIGGEITLKEVAGKSVCQRCNNGVLSILDRELCNRSFLSVVASQEIAASLWQVWNIDHSAQNLLVEAKPCWEQGELKRLVCHPQMIFEKEGPQIRYDREELERFGEDRARDVMVRAVHRAFQRFNAGERGRLHFERVRVDLSPRGYRLPPRVYAPRSFQEIAANLRNQSFVLRFSSPEDRKLALRSMSDLENGYERRFKQTKTFVGSQVPPIGIYFDLGLVIRAMMKIAVNLLAAFCTKTTVNSSTFPEATRMILGETHPQPIEVAGNGFVHCEDIKVLARPDSHCFRITTLENEWILYMSFFGGRIGAAVSFPGPNREEWNTMEIVAPLHSKQWTVMTSQIYQPLKVRVNWHSLDAILPSMKLQYSQWRMLVDEVSSRKIN